MGISTHKIHINVGSIANIEDPNLYVGELLVNWEKSEKGKWVIAHALETPIWHTVYSATKVTYDCKVSALLEEVDYLYFKLQWP